jgi:hypothetical protein
MDRGNESMSMENGFELDFPNEPDAESNDEMPRVITEVENMELVLSSVADPLVPSNIKLTDRAKLTQLLSEWGVPFIVDPYDKNSIMVGKTDYVSGPNFPNADTVGGYSGFYTEFSFNDDGSFDQMGAYE